MNEKTEAGEASTENMLISTLRTCGFFVRTNGLARGERPQVLGNIDHALAFFKLAVAGADAAAPQPAAAPVAGDVARGDGLLPCPFCGTAPRMNEHPPHTHSALLGLPVHTGSFTIECPTEDCCGMIASTKSEVAAAWNRRAAQPSHAQVAALRDIAAERQRQISVEGLTTENDDRYTTGDMAVAASCYAWAGCERAENDVQSKRLPLDWPWSAAWWKPKDKRSNLVRAGALILAEIERLDRAAAKQQGREA